MSIESLDQIPIHPRADGRGWTFRYRAADGSRPRITRPTLLEALAAWLEIELDCVVTPGADATDEALATGPTLAEFFDGVYAIKHMPGLSDQIREQYERYFDDHVRPELGGEPVGTIGTKRISDLIAAMHGKPRMRQGKPIGGTTGAETIRKTLTMLQGVFTLAIQEELRESNPVSAVKKPSKPVPKVVRPLTIEQVERLRAHFLQKGDLWSLLYVVLVAYAGLRPSEPLALRRDDVRERTMLIHRTASRGMARHLKNRLPYRTVVLEPFLKDDIELATSEVGITGDKLLLSDELGEMLDSEDRKSWQRYVLKPALNTLELPITRTYDLRHTCASLMLAAHRAVHEVAAQLGHGADMTLNVYGHLIEEYRGQPAIDIAARVRAAREG